MTVENLIELVTKKRRKHHESVRNITKCLVVSKNWSNFELRSKVGYTLEMQINSNLFGISLDLHYLCRPRALTSFL